MNFVAPRFESLARKSGLWLATTFVLIEVSRSFVRGLLPRINSFLELVIHVGGVLGSVSAH